MISGLHVQSMLRRGRHIMHWPLTRVHVHREVGVRGGHVCRGGGHVMNAMIMMGGGASEHIRIMRRRRMLRAR